MSPLNFSRLYRLVDRRLLTGVALLIVGFLIGVLVGGKHVSAAVEEPSAPERPAYLIASWKILHPDELKPFGDAVIPLAKKAGWTPLAGSLPEVLEGTWPDGHILFVQQYTSMQALRDFWRSEAHAKVIPLRKDHVESRFVVAVEAQR